LASYCFGIVLLIACANVANLIGAGRARLVQLVLGESALIAALAAVMGAWFSWWSAPVIVSMINPPDHPARLALPADARVFAFGLVLTLLVTLLFGLAPALQASAVSPGLGLKGSTAPHSKRRTMQLLIAAQVAFCFLVVFLAG
jgi:putative ABC transport system permease protein